MSRARACSDRTVLRLLTIILCLIIYMLLPAVASLFCIKASALCCMQFLQVARRCGPAHACTFLVHIQLYRAVVYRHARPLATFVDIPSHRPPSLSPGG